MKLFFPHGPVSWNEYIAIERGNKYAASAFKKKQKEQVCAEFFGMAYDGKYPITITFRPHFKNKRRDLDNVVIKGILDGLVACGVIRNDNLKHIQRIILEPVFDDTEGIEVIIEPLEE